MDFQTIIIIVAVVLLLAYLFNRMQSRGSQMGSERPSYNDPNVQGQGSFGSNRSNPNVSNYQRDQRDQNRFDNAPGTQSQSSPRRGNDSQEVEGRGSFGRDKD